MKGANARIILRLVAIAIATVAMIDPALSAREPAAPPVVLIRLTAGSADAVVDRLRAALPGGDVVVREAAGPRVPCAPAERCVLIADGWVDVDLPRDPGLALSMIRVPVTASPNVAIHRVLVPAGVHATAAAAATVELSGAGVAGRRTEVRIMDGAAMVGSSAIEWPATSADTATATLEIPFWPMTPNGVIRIEAAPAPGETIVFDNTVDVGVPAVDAIRALIVDTRPSWPSTFVRRALQDDPRFVVNYRSTIATTSRMVAAGTTNEGLTEAALERTEVLIAGGLDALSARDVALIDRFVRVRGGTAILLPDRQPSGEVARLMPGEWREQLLPTPEHIGPLHASEILKNTRPSPAAIVLGGAAGDPAIVVEPRGEGRLVVSGAMDAWRYRHLDEAPSTSLRASAFDRFWRSIAADTGAASRALQIGLEAPLAANGARVAFTMRHRTMSGGAALDARMFARCGEQAGRDVRAWPTGRLHVFTGEIPAAAPGPCIITASANATDGDAAFAVAGRPVPAASETLRKLERTVIASGGVIADAGSETSVARSIAETSPPSLQAVTIHPMRSPWWIVPFAVCLSAEWWLRRRAGLR